MVRLLIDEDLPGAVARALNGSGQDARRVVDVGLRGAPDRDVYAFAVENGFVLVTADLGLSDPFRYPPVLRHRAGAAP